jgi:hypothetical protein
MKTVILPLLSFFSLFEAGEAFAENSSCKDTIIVFNDDNPRVPGGSQTPSDGQAPRVTMVLDCMASSTNIPESTTLHFFTYSQGKFCQASRICGNVKAWRGQFKIGTRVYWGQSLFPHSGTSTYSRSNGCDEENDNDRDNSGREYVYPGNWWGSPQYCDSGRSSVYAEFRIARDIIKRDCSAVEDWQCLDVPHP